MRKNEKYIYAFCRSYEPFDESIRNEYRITLGTSPEPLVVLGYNLFKDKKKARIARLEPIGRGNGVIIASIRDCLKQESVNREIPIDDLVEAEDILGPYR